MDMIHAARPQSPVRMVGITGSGLIGRDPFDRRAWSTLSYFFFTELRRQGALQRAFGVEVPALRRYLLMAKNVHPVREVWRNHFYMDPVYRRALTEQIRAQLRPTDFGCDFLQLGAMYDVPSLVQGRRRCCSYHDGNLAEWLRSPYVPRGLSARRIDQALAFERHVYHGMSHIFTMGDYLRESFIRDFDVLPERVSSIGAGINLDAVPPTVPDKDYASQEVLFIGVDFARKGGWELLKAFRAVHQRLPKARLHIVGPKTLTVPADMEAGVVYHGFLSKSVPAQQAQLNELFRRCCLFVMPSLYEPFGVAPLEAMVHGLPCVVTNRWALPQIVGAGQTGVVVEVGSVEDLESKLTEMVPDAARLARMGTAARERVLNYYTWDKVVERLIGTLSQNRADARAVSC